VPHKKPLVKTGLDLLVEENFARLKSKRVALLGHPASIDSRVRHLLDLCLDAGINIVRLFGAEHGFLGNAQDMETVSAHKDPRTGIDVISLYGKTEESLRVKPEQLKDVDVLVCDLQDVGSRYYTFAYTIAFAMRACAQTKTKCLVLDRPNPIGGVEVEGNDVLPAFSSFVGEYPVASRHGMTMGELATLFHHIDHSTCDLEVVWMHGWKRHMLFGDTGLPWAYPSPNMPTPDTALVYPGGCLFEGTNVSEGRGTTRPFELIGAPFIDPDRFAALTRSQELEGVALRPCWFTPKFQKHAGQLCGGVQIHVTRADVFRPLHTALALLWAARQFEGFDWRREPYEFVSDRLAIDLLFGDDRPRLALEADQDVSQVEELFVTGNKRFQELCRGAIWAGYRA